MPSHSQKRPLCIAVTGGIGAGKSIVAAVFARRGAKIFRADDAAKELMRTDPAVRDALRMQFGAQTFTADNSLNVAYIAGTVFRDPERLAALNAIVHPAVERVMRAAMDNCAAQVFAVDAALIYEARVERQFDYVVVVAAEDELRLRRAAARDGGGEEEIRRRMRAQMPQAKTAEAADFVLTNNGTLPEIEAAADNLYSLLLQLPKRNDIE